MATLEQIATITLPLVIGGAIGFYFDFARGYSKRYFDEKDRVKRHQLEVARHVLRICNEASTGSFRVAPQDIEDVNSTMTDLDGIDEKLGAKMTEMIASWGTFARERGNGGNTGDDAKFLKEQFDRAETNRVILIDWANKVRNGK